MKKTIISLPLILSICLTLIVNFVHHPESVIYSLIYNIVVITMLIATVSLFYFQVKAKIKR